MKKFEYKSTYVDKIKPTLENLHLHTLYNNKAFLDGMNQLGSEGWELVLVIDNTDTWTDNQEIRVSGFTASSFRIPITKTDTKGYYLVWKREV